MINTAYSIDSKHPVEAFLTAKKNYIPGVTEIVHMETPKDLRSASKYYEDGIFNGNAYQTLELNDTVYENNLYESFEYARYWHGYLAYLRPLLVFFNYEQITIVSMIVFVALLGGCTYFIWKKIGILPATMLVLSCLSVDLFIVTESINEIICFDLALIFSIFLLTRKHYHNIGLYFFIFGSITNFIDFLTNPIVTYGIPIIIYFMLLFKEDRVTLKEVFYIYFETSILWFGGYLLTWISKWVITDLLLNRGIIENAVEQIRFRTDTHIISKNEFFQTLKYHLSNEMYMIVYCVWILMFLGTFKNIKKRYSKEQDTIKNITILTYFIAIAIPFVWYLVLLQHSFIHIFFTYRNVMITIFATGIFVLEITNSVYHQNDRTE